MTHVGCGGEVWSFAPFRDPDPITSLQRRHITRCNRCGKSVEWDLKGERSDGGIPGRVWFTFEGEEESGLLPSEAVQ